MLLLVLVLVAIMNGLQKTMLMRAKPVLRTVKEREGLQARQKKGGHKGHLLKRSCEQGVLSQLSRSLFNRIYALKASRFRFPIALHLVLL